MRLYLVAVQSRRKKDCIKEHTNQRSCSVVHIQAQGDLSGCMGTLREVLYRLLSKLVKLGAYNHCNVDEASAFSLDQARTNFHAQNSNSVSKYVQFISFVSQCNAEQSNAELHLHLYLHLHHAFTQNN
jgi:ERCC4-related helicase